MKHLGTSDFERLSSEMSARTSSSAEWAKSVGMDPNLLDMLGNRVTNMTHDKAVELAKKAFLAEQEPTEDGTAILKMDIGDVIKEACISMFALGFETHKQFGGADAGE